MLSFQYLCGFLIFLCVKNLGDNWGTAVKSFFADEKSTMFAVCPGTGSGASASPKRTLTRSSLYKTVTTSDTFIGDSFYAKFKESYPTDRLDSFHLFSYKSINSTLSIIACLIF